MNGPLKLALTALLSLLGVVTSASAQTISVNAGGSAAGSFVADAYYSGGSTYTTTNTIDTSLLTGTAPPQAVFQSERYGELTYTVPGLTASAASTVTLYFEESYWTAAGQRTFNVAINGATVLTAFDIFATAGAANKAIARTFNATANASGQVVIAFTKGGGPDNPKICGITVAASGPSSYTLTVNKAGTGSGTVSGGAINCGSTCTASVAGGTSVALTATAASGSTFAGWSGACTGTSASCTISMTAAQSVTASFNTTPPPPTGVSINAGGSAAGSFVADAYYSGGSTYTTTNPIDTSLITGTAPPQAVFQSERYGEFTYTVPNLTAGSAYGVTLYFEESYWTAAGQRAFDVAINGTAVLSAFDIFASAGAGNRAIARPFNATADGSGQLVIAFTKGGGPDNPKICGITVAAGGPPPNYSLTVNKAGTGSGTVSGGAINCGSTCTASVAAGTAVPLTATATSGSTFAGWSGACTGTSATCTVTMTAAQTVTATFNTTPPPPSGISVNAGGSATGSFVADAYFSGGSTYTTTNAIDTSLVTGTPPPQAVLQSERYGEFTYTIPSLTAGGAYAVTLYFEESYWTAAGQRTFNVAINGTTALSAFDIFATAGAANRAVARTFNATANASGQVVIAFTKGGGPDNPKTCGITVASGVVQTYTLYIAASTNGSTNPPAGTYTYPAGTSVTVTATPASGYTFVAWSYSTSESTNPLTIVMDQNKQLTANFAPVQTNTFTLAIGATGTGTTNPAPGTYTYNSGASVTVTAVPASGATFTGWSGAATGTSNPVTISMNGNKTLTGAFSGGTPTLACPSLPGAPTGTPPLPTSAQAAYQRTEMTAFIHYSMATYDGSEQGNPSDPPSLFSPSNLNATTVGQWASSLKAAGFGQAMLVAKHSVGFCLWPSAYTSYSVKSSPWMSGNGDVVQLFTDAMHNNGMRVALYLAPWDQKYPSSSSSYETYFKNQATELLNYGPAYEFEFDGFNAPTSSVNWRSVFQLIKQEQPNILLWAGPEIVNTGAIPDLQWIGNENGQATRSTSSLDTRNCGGGNTWCPFECNVSSRRPNWFWHPNDTPMSLSDLQKVYFATVGMNCTLNFNVPPSQTGAFDSKDLTLLQQFGTWYSALYKTNLVKGQPVTADSTWANAGFDATKAVDDDVCTYWAAAAGKTTVRLEVTPASPISAKLISIREAIELGERVKTYHVEIKQNGTWNRTPTDSSGARIQGTLIGQRQLWQLNSTNVQAVALVIDSAKDAPAIAEFSVY